MNVLTNKLVLVTGASGGIGLAIVRLLLQEQARLLLTGRRFEELSTLLDEFPDQRGGVTFIKADLTHHEDRDQLVAKAEELGGVDILMNMAGILHFGLFEKQTASEICQLLKVNVEAPLLLTQSLIPQLLSKNSAQIMNVGSILGSIEHPGFVAYSATKAALKSFSQGLQRELADTNVSVKYIAPRSTDTLMNPSALVAMNNKLGNKSDAPMRVAKLIVQQLKNHQSLVYVGWPEKLFVRVNALLPSVVSSALRKQLSTIKHFAKKNHLEQKSEN